MKPPRVTAGDAIFLDLDGTLIDIAPTPDAARPAPGLPALLEETSQRAGSALAVVSGRPIREIDRILAPLALPAAGLHGLERRTAGGAFRPPPALPRYCELRAALARFANGHPGLLLEDKGAALAVHYRARPDLGASVAAAVEDALGGARSGIAVQRGKAVVEVRPDCGDKGTAVMAFMSEPPFAGRRPVFAGDDITDEAAFRAVRQMGGVTVRVGSEGATAAEWRLADVAAVHAWLAAMEG
ncbi:MAG: trehalose-phosphatase [Alphaproteobacteria bacterium]|nr:trehalose-phosphatase [Alphaproteobacteria bacterium]